MINVLILGVRKWLSHVIWQNWCLLLLTTSASNCLQHSRNHAQAICGRPKPRFPKFLICPPLKSNRSLAAAEESTRNNNKVEWKRRMSGGRTTWKALSLIRNVMLSWGLPGWVDGCGHRGAMIPPPLLAVLKPVVHHQFLLLEIMFTSMFTFTFRQPGRLGQ